jgi:hypothetical protein
LFEVQDTLGLKRVRMLSRQGDDTIKEFSRSLGLIYNKTLNSQITFKTKSFYVDQYGNVSPETVEIFGEIAKKRVGDWLPKNYSVGQK